MPDCWQHWADAAAADAEVAGVHRQAHAGQLASPIEDLRESVRKTGEPMIVNRDLARLGDGLFRGRVEE